MHVLIVNAYIKSLFNYCPLVWMFCYRRIMHKMNKIHERSLRLLLKNYKDDFQDLLRSSGDISIHQRCINSLLTEVYKYIHGISPVLKQSTKFSLPELISIIHDNLMFSKLTTLTRTYMDSIRYLTKPTNSGTYFLKISNHIRHQLYLKAK